MKKMMVFVLTFIFAFSCFVCHAEDLSFMTLEELTVRRQELINELTQINSLRGSMIRQQAEEGIVSEEALGKIIDLFPDEELAKIIRDKCAKFSIEQSVSKRDLEKIKIIQVYGVKIHDLTGIGYLTNLTHLNLVDYFDGIVLPDELQKCKALEAILIFENKNLTVLPDWIGTLENLQKLELANTSIAKLPDSICNLSNLEELYDRGNKLLTSLPDNIGNLISLKKLNISETGISSLPDSIWNLQLTSLDMSGTSIR